MVKNAFGINPYIHKELSLCGSKTADDGTKFTLR